MNKKITVLIVLLMITCIFTQVFSYETQIEIQNIAAPTVQPTENDFRTELSLTINSIELTEDADDDLKTLIQFFSGLNIRYAAQTGSIPMISYDFRITGEDSFFTYEGQLTTPYYVRSNFLGTETYMIYPEDRFEEKLFASIYKIMNKMSDTDSDLPDIDSVNALIDGMREGENNFAFASPDITNEVYQDINLNAFEEPLIKFMMKFEETEPESGIRYLYIDLPWWKREFTWPNINSLPAFETPSKTLSAVYDKDDLMIFIDALPQFFSDNPEFAEMLNQQIRSGLINSDPQLAEAEGVDYLEAFVLGLKETVEADFKDNLYNVTIDQAENGDLIRFLLEIDRPEESADERMTYVYQTTSDEEKSVIEFAIDSSDISKTTPLFRLMIKKTSDENNSERLGVNFRFDDAEDLRLEYEQSTEYYSNSRKAKISDTDFRFDLNNELGSGKVHTVSTLNDSGKEDSASQISYKHSSEGKPLFSASITAENRTTAPLPGISENGTLPASQLSEDDYDQIAANIFMYIMMLSMKFM